MCNIYICITVSFLGFF